MLKNILLSIMAIIIMFLPIIIAFVFNLKIAERKDYFTLSIYGIYMIFYMIIQMVFSFLNKRRIENIHKKTNRIIGKYNILVVGYREDPILFKKCLVSIKNLTHQENINKVLIVVDGNDEQDKYMSIIAENILESAVINLTELPATNHNINSTPNIWSKFTCILQPHKGKRHALYTGLKITCDDHTADGVFCTDSDTELDPDALYYLANLMESDEKYGAVTGNVQIINANSFISYMSSLRYWFACNLERGYQSFNNCVLCVSGPLGLYKKSCLSQFLRTWLDQEFLGMECTYGDDRHLTNNTLLLGYKVGYTHLSKCDTDTPESLSRFFTQQVRWCKSSIREFAWNVKCLDKHSLWMTIDLIYQTIYSFVVLGSLLYTLYIGTSFQFLIYMITLIVFNGIKGIYATILTGSFKYILFSFYGIVYITFMVPAKLYAGITIKDTAWGTSSRLEILNKIELKHVFLVFWNILIIGSICFNIVHNTLGLVEFITMGAVFGYILILFIIILVLSMVTNDT